jgi:hypothetical protein
LFASREVEDLLRTTARIQYSFQCPVQIIGVECERKKHTHTDIHRERERDRDRDRETERQREDLLSFITHLTRED